MKVLCCAYRGWGLSAWHWLCSQRVKYDFERVDLAKNVDEFNEALNSECYDVIVLAGWSWIVSKKIVEDNFIIGIHPSDLPDYAGGSPLQHQIIDGLEHTRASLFRLTPELDGGPVIYKADLDLTGGMKEIQAQLTDTAIELLRMFFSRWPNVSYMEQPKREHKPRKRIKPEDSVLTKERIEEMTCKELYNFIRCREDPYPNVYIEDKSGRLIFKRVQFVG